MPSKRDVTVKALSSNLLQMKFMKRSAMDIQKKDEEELFKDSAEHWVIDEHYAKEHKNDMSIQLSHAMCEDLPFGRMSFKGFNPAIEKLMGTMNGEESIEETIPEEDIKFAETYASVSNINKKFSTKREHSAKQSEKQLRRVRRGKSAVQHEHGGKREKKPPTG